VFGVVGPSPLGGVAMRCILLWSLATACFASGCVGARHGPPEFVLGPGEVRFGARTGAGKAAEALVTSGATVAAAAVNHAVAKTCYAACPMGLECNPATGLCGHLPCHGACQAWEQCREVEGEEQCFRADEPGRGALDGGAWPATDD